MGFPPHPVRQCRAFPRRLSSSLWTQASTLRRGKRISGAVQRRSPTTRRSCWKPGSCAARVRSMRTQPQPYGAPQTPLVHGWATPNKQNLMSTQYRARMVVEMRTAAVNNTTKTAITKEQEHQKGICFFNRIQVSGRPSALFRPVASARWKQSGKEPRQNPRDSFSSFHCAVLG